MRQAAVDLSTHRHLRPQVSSPSHAADALWPLSPNKSIALVHDWCPSFRGGERVLAELARTFASTDVFTLFDFLPEDIKKAYFPGVSFHTSFANRLPKVERYYRALFAACPFLIEQFDVTKFDAVISSSAAFARGVLVRPDQPHLCYVHSPIRYAWDEQFNYLEQGKLGFGPKGLVFRQMLHKLRMWDARTAHGPDLMVANSNFVRKRIKRIYGRDATVVFPPVEFSELEFSNDKDDYFIAASFLAPYKRTDLIIEAFNALPNKRLLVVGEGQQSKALRERAGPNIEFTGYLPRKEYATAIAKARAFVFAGCEDFGIALAEAQAAGTPLIAYGRGGATDIVLSLGSSDDPTGVLFEKQTVDSLLDAISRFEDNERLISPEACRANAQRFSSARFRKEMQDVFEQTLHLHAGI